MLIISIWIFWKYLLTQILGLVFNGSILFVQYSGYEKKEMDDVYSNQKQLSDVVADYFFVCPTNLFANIVSSRGARVYYYFFTHVSYFSLLVYNINNNNRITIARIIYPVIQRLQKKYIHTTYYLFVWINQTIVNHFILEKV